MYNKCPSLAIAVTLLVFLVASFAQQKTCAVLELFHLKDDTVRISENDINLTFWLNVSGCKQLDSKYRVTVKIKTNTGIPEEAGRVAITSGTCNITVMGSLQCVGPAGPVQLYRRVNRSHVGIEWKWSWKDDETFYNKNMSVQLTISYPPRITNLTVEAQEVKGHYVINKSQQVNIVCSFDQGNPPTTFRLLDKSGRELDNVTRKESELIHPLAAVHCEQPWPVVGCEAQGSSENRSVTFLVRCPPQFIDMPPKQIDLEAADHVTFNMKGHTTEGARCLLIPESVRENSSREMNCTLSGSPPDLLLTLDLQKKDRAIRGNWTLTVSNEIGAGNTTVVFNQDYGTTTGSFRENSKTNIAVYITIPACSIFLIIVVTVFLGVRRRIIRKYAAGSRTTDGTSTKINDSQRRSPSNGNYEGEGHGSARNGAMSTEMPSTSGNRNADGLIYGDLDFTTKQASAFIIGKASETEYADINVTAVVPPSRDYKNKINKRNEH